MAAIAPLSDTPKAADKAITTVNRRPTSVTTSSPDVVTEIRPCCNRCQRRLSSTEDGGLYTAVRDDLAESGPAAPVVEPVDLPANAVAAWKSPADLRTYGTATLVLVRGRTHVALTNTCLEPACDANRVKFGKFYDTFDQSGLKPKLQPVRAHRSRSVAGIVKRLAPPVFIGPGHALGAFRDDSEGVRLGAARRSRRSLESGPRGPAA